MSKRIRKCPICGAEIECEEYQENFGLAEAYESCKRCGYSYEFIYGNEREIVKGKEFIWGWRTPVSDPIFRHIKKAEYEAKRNWRKRKRTYLTYKSIMDT